MEKFKIKVDQNCRMTEGVINDSHILETVCK